ncbi:MAG: CRISPR-associated helicase Cas3' [Saprospiraceae bacterium]
MSFITPLGKPSGITLADHTNHVVEEARKVLDIFPFLKEKYARLTDGGDLETHVLVAARDHDLGKENCIWQKACQADNELYRKWRVQSGLDPNGVNSSDYSRFEAAIFRGDVSRPHHLMKSGLRHEFASIPRMPKHSLTMEAVVAIGAHHGKLSLRHEHRWLYDGGGDKDTLIEGAYAKQWRFFKKAADKNSKGRTDERQLKEIYQIRYRFDIPRALLQLADTRASRMESLGANALPKLLPWKFAWPSEWHTADGTPSYRPVQRIALGIAERNEFVSILRAPTGSGKTAASLLWANRQIERGRADRLVVAMPTRFTANALAKGTEDLVGEAGLYHSSAFFNRYGELSSAERYQAKELHLLAQKLVTPVTVCTVDHLLIALTGAKEHHHASFAFLAHSAVVFDEADFYDAFVQANLKFLLDALRALEVPVLIMSATVPESARDHYEVSSKIDDADKAEAAERTPPKRLVKYGGEVSAPIDVRTHLEQMLREGNGIIYANTVARAMAYRSFLKELQAEFDPELEVEIVLYHSRFTEPHKKDKEEKLVALLGDKAWRKGKPSSIAILTQIGEMSINISTSNMLSEACPWDRLSQRIGRLNRFGESSNATCVVVAPMKDGSIYPAPYGEYLRKEGWMPSEPLNRTVDHLKSLPKDGVFVTPVEMTEWVNKLYLEAEKPTAAARENLRSYEQLVRESVLILPNIQSDDENASAHDWSARQIGTQATVLTRALPRAANWGEWEEHKLRFGLTVPKYQVEMDQRQENSKLECCTAEIGFGDEPTKVTYYYAPAFNDEQDDILTGGGDVYNSELGLFGLYDLGNKAEDLKGDE